jgi:ATP-binding cassette, subfamily B, bacterial
LGRFRAIRPRGGAPLHEIGLAELRETVGFIPQTPFIFDASLRENILMGMTEESIGTDRLLNAVRLAQLDDLIASRASTGGLDSPAGSGGATLSGGERQRIALARVFLRDPRVIICDEYTANIDNATARLIQQALGSHFAGRTRIVITHQLYTVRDADRIIVLERGGVAGSGTHDEMLAQPGLYQDLWAVQKLG